MKPSFPQIIDNRYRLGKCIGTGGMGCVYEAVHVGVGRPVAIKTLRQDIELNTRSVSRLQREARIAGAIGHDHICEVTDTGITDEGLPYMVMPLLKGQTLKSLLQSEAPLPFDRAVNIVCRVLDGLKAAHAQGVVHRDLKPGNVFLTTVGNQDDFVKILDFGISKRMNGTESTELTKTGTVLGTPLYMSPEQACGAPYIDHRTDIYSAGVLLYEMITGVRPFEGDTYNEIITKIVGAPFPAPITANPKIPKALNRIVLKSMARNPDDRFGDSAEMRTALTAIRSVSAAASDIQGNSTGTRNGEAVPFAVRIDKGRRVAPPVRRRIYISAGAAALLFAGGLYCLGFASGRAEDSQAAAPSESKPPTSPPVPKIEASDLPVSGPLPDPQESPASVSFPTAVNTQAVAAEPSPIDVQSEAGPPKDKPKKKPRVRKPQERDARTKQKSDSKTLPGVDSQKSIDTVNTFSGKKNTLFSEDYDS